MARDAYMTKAIEGGRETVRATLAVLAVLTALLAGPGARASSIDDCRSTDPNTAIRACTALIESGTFRGLELNSLYFARALSYYRKGDFDRSIADYDFIIREDSSNAVAINNRAWSNYRAGRPAKGVDDIEWSLRLDPDNPHSLDTRAHISQALGNAGSALRDYERAIAVGGSRIVKLYQCGLQERGLYNGHINGFYNEATKAAMETCVRDRKCDPLPADETLPEDENCRRGQS